ncbi:MAG: helix-turn-helix domain-containing protein [Polyangiaceae bacterium]
MNNARAKRISPPALHTGRGPASGVFAKASASTDACSEPAEAEARGPASGPRTPGPFPRLPEVGLDLRDAVESFENQLIVQALERTNGNKRQAAQLLGLDRTTLVEMLKRKRIGVDEP